MGWRSENFPKDDAEKGFRQYFAVKPQRAVAQVVEVVFQSAQHLLYRVGISIV